MSLKVRLVVRANEQNKYQESIEHLDKYFFPGAPYYKASGTYWWLVFDDEKVIGYAGLDATRIKDKAFLCRAGIMSQYRGLGLHKRLIKARERMARKLGFEKIVTYTSHNNISSSNSLIKRGYVIYRPGAEWGVDHAIYFCKDL